MQSSNCPEKLVSKSASRRRDIMATMAEMNFHLPNVSSEKQEIVAKFMVEQLRGAVVNMAAPKTTTNNNHEN